MERSVSSRLAEAGIDPVVTSDPHAAFLALVAAEGGLPTLDDRLAVQAIWSASLRTDSRMPSGCER